MQANWQDFIVGSNGVFIVNDITEKSGVFGGIYILEDTVISRIEINGDTATDVKADYISTPATALKAGALITSIDGTYFSAVTLSSGSVALIRI